MDGGFKYSDSDKESAAPRSRLVKDTSTKEALRVDSPIALESTILPTPLMLPLPPILLLTLLILVLLLRVLLLLLKRLMLKLRGLKLMWNVRLMYLGGLNRGWILRYRLLRLLALLPLTNIVRLIKSLQIVLHFHFKI